MLSDYELLCHIRDEILVILNGEKDLSKEKFLKDEIIKRAFVRSLEIIGEAVKNLSNDLVFKNDHIPWRSMTAMRDRLIHGYFSVDYDIVWDVVTKKLPDLRVEIERLIESG